MIIVYFKWLSNNFYHSIFQTMYRVLFVLFLSCFVVGYSQAQTLESRLQGQWEDDASTRSDSYQLVFKKGELAFVKVAQTDLLEPVPLPRKVLHSYRWLNNSLLRYSKLPEKDPMLAKFNPRRHKLLRIDSLRGNLLYVTLADADWSKKELDSIVKDERTDFRLFFSDKKVRYRRLDFKKQQNRALLLGLWEDQTSNDSTSFQFYVQKGRFGFNKINKKDPAQITSIKPNAGYDYYWITDKIVGYRRQPLTGIVRGLDDPADQLYTLMRIETLNRNELKVTLSSRPFNEAALEYIKAENQLDLYFFDNTLHYKRIPVVRVAVAEE